MKLFTLILFIAFSSQAYAQCFVVGDLKGHSARENENFEVIDDAISGQKFIIEINGENSSVTPNDMSCLEVSVNSLMCFSQASDKKSTVETWTVYPSNNKVVYTKAINGYGVFDGGKLLVGSVKGRCE